MSLLLPVRPANVERDSIPSTTTFDRVFVGAVILLGIIVTRITTPDQEFSSLVETNSPLSELMWGSLYVVAIVGLLRRSASFGRAFRSSWLVAAIIVLALLSTLWSDDPSVTARRAVGLLGTSACAYYIASRFSLHGFIDTLSVVVIAAAIISIAIIVVAPSAGLMHLEYAGAWRGLFAHKNRLGMFLAFGLISVVITACRARGPRAAFYWAGAGLCALELVATRSVTSIMAAVVCAVTLIVAYAVSRRRVSLGAVACFVLLGVGAIAVFVSWAAAGDQNPILEFSGRDATLTGRTQIWSNVLTAILARPLGYGYDVFWDPGGSFLQYNPGTATWRPFHAHDGYLELSLDLGLIGLALMLALLVQALRASWRLAVELFTLDRACPLAAIVFFITLNVTEAYIAKYNDFDWIIFLTFFLFAVSNPAPKATAAAGQTSAPKARLVIGEYGLARRSAGKSHT